MPASRGNRPGMIPPSCVGDRWSQEAQRRPHNQAPRRPLSGPPAKSAPFRPGAGMRHNPSVENWIPTDRFQRPAVIADRNSGIGGDRARQVMATSMSVALAQQQPRASSPANVSSWPRPAVPGPADQGVRKFYSPPPAKAAGMSAVGRLLPTQDTQGKSADCPSPDVARP